MLKLKKIISGGQTGADQGALDAAIGSNFPYGGAIPAGRLTETRPLPDRYRMDELDSGHYPVRTAKNVVDSDGTLVVSRGPLTGGSLLTVKIARDRQKPYIHIDFEKEDLESGLGKVATWVESSNISILNVAGPRASSDGTIYDVTRQLISALLDMENKHGR